MKRTLILLFISLLLASCSGTAIEPTLTSVPPTDTSIPPTATPVPPTDTPVPPTSTPLPTEVVILIKPEAMVVVSSWNSTINAFTPADDPLTDLTGLTANDVGFWNNSRLGFDLYKSVSDLLSADLGSPWDQGLYGCPQVEEAFTSCSLRIYFTDDSITEISGAAKVTFQSNP